MKFFSAITLALASSAFAFPAVRLDDPEWIARVGKALENPEISQQMRRAMLSRADAPANVPVLVPAKGDTAHRFIAPGPTDQRGPCPGLNSLANHGYIPRNGIATMGQLIEGQLEVFNVGRPLGALLALIATALDGDLISTKLSLGGKDVRTMPLGALQGLLSDEPGLNGHNHFEGDASLTRSDFYLNNGDDYTFQVDKWVEMLGFVEKYSKNDGRFDFNSMSMYRWHRYNQSLAANDKFIWAPQHILEYGAASFTYASYVNGTDSNQNSADVNSVASFFGAQRDPKSKLGWKKVPERIPNNWYRRPTVYDIRQVGGQMFGMAKDHPVPFGFRAGNGAVFVNVIDPFASIPEVKLPGSIDDLNRLCCDLFGVAYSLIPATVSAVPNLLRDRLEFILGALFPAAQDSCNCGQTVPLANYTNPIRSPAEARSAGAKAFKGLL